MTKINEEMMIPQQDDLFEPFGFCEDLEKIMLSRAFFPTVITGETGNGKTYMVEQVAAKTGTPLNRINVHIDTDEIDLIGDMALVKDGGVSITRYEKGPIIRAMEMGITVLLDEFDLMHPSKAMCLQSILEGQGYFIKKTGEMIRPTKGFNIIATANTKGRGDDTRMYIGANVLNAASLDRFPITLEHDFPNPDIETKILTKLAKSLPNSADEWFIDSLIKWTEQIRKSYKEKATEAIITTRRLIHIIRHYNIFQDEQKAVEQCVATFCQEDQQSLLDLYKNISYRNKEGANGKDSDDDEMNATQKKRHIPF